MTSRGLGPFSCRHLTFASNLSHRAEADLRRRPDGWPATDAEIASEQAEIARIDYQIPTEIRPVVVARLTKRLAKGSSKDAEIRAIHYVVVVGVSSQHLPYLELADRTSTQIDSA